jgi:disulfide bond formation protein DsbB
VRSAARRTVPRDRLVAGGVTGAACAALIIAYFVEYGLHMAPCELCLIERWPYRLTALVAVVAFGVPRLTRPLLAVAAIVMLAGVGVAFLHVGVEAGWWPSPFPECNSVLVPGQPLPLIPAIPCDRPVFLIPPLPLSMAAMDLCLAAAFVIGISTYLLRTVRSHR